MSKHRRRQSRDIDPSSPGTWGPANEATRRRAIRCPVQMLFERGHLGVEEVRAAREIERVFVALTAGLFAKASLQESRGRRVDMGEIAAMAHARRYRPWADALSARHKAGGPPLLEVVIDCVVDGRSLAAVERDRRWRHGRAAGYLREGLELYVAMAGWKFRAA
ncbi:MAG TPA: hypothetical protein VEU47_11820 [Candidatus Cybelea sp.]|nr:hypothetical protein [Candidatus Cybelea sp.]